jgi:DNA modification methylase
LGLEPTIEMYVGHIVLICRELRRVLRDDGTFWLNFGDSYAQTKTGASSRGDVFAHGRTDGRVFYEGDRARGREVFKAREMMPAGLKPKDLCAIPWRVALALQADGWWLRSDIVWAKGLSFCPTYSGSCMPESVTDRPTKGHEYVFLLSKSARYFYDGDAVREANVKPFDNSHRSSYQETASSYSLETGHKVKSDAGLPLNPAGRNLRTVWAINPGSYAGAHFATFPPALVEPMIKAGTSERGCCPTCGKAWERVIEKSGGTLGKSWHNHEHDQEQGMSQYMGYSGGIGAQVDADGKPYTIGTLGWRPSCQCPEQEPVPCTVLDPFGGAGTTGDVARQLGRRWVMVELSEAYCRDHIIPRLEEPLIEWAQEQPESDPEPEQMRFTL